MSAIKTKIGHTRTATQEEFEVRDKAMSGDIVMVISPDTVAKAPTAAVWTRTVTVSLKTAAGQLHDWLTQDFANKVSIADTSALGTASIASTTLSIVNGVAAIVVSGDAAAWLAAETDTLTIAAPTVLGVSVTGKTSVQTFA